MADFMMLMLGSESLGDWDAYIEKLVESGHFRGGSSLGRGVRVARDGDDRDCLVTGFIRLVATDLAEVRALLEGNPLYEAGGRVELLEEIPE